MLITFCNCLLIPSFLFPRLSNISTTLRLCWWCLATTVWFRLVSIFSVWVKRLPVVTAFSFLPNNLLKKPRFFGFACCGIAESLLLSVLFCSTILGTSAVSFSWVAFRSCMASFISRRSCSFSARRRQIVSESSFGQIPAMPSSILSTSNRSEWYSFTSVESQSATISPSSDNSVMCKFKSCTFFRHWCSSAFLHSISFLSRHSNRPITMVHPTMTMAVMMPKAIHLQICPVCSLRSMLFTFYVSITSLLLCTNILIGKDNGRKYQRRIFIYIITTFM